MSNQIKPFLVQDPLLALDDSLNYAVYRGGQNISTQKFPASSKANTSHVYSIQVPSTSTVMSRALIWGATIKITVSGVVAVGQHLVNYPKHDVLAPFPLNQLCNNMSIQLNNTNVQANVNQILDPLLRSINKDAIARWCSTTPTQLDAYGNYLDLESANTATNESILNSPFNGYGATLDRSQPPRGAFPVKITGNSVGAVGELSKTVVIEFTVQEPIFVSPFIFGDPEGAAGLCGLTQLNINCQMDPLAKRALRWVGGIANITSKAVASVEYEDAYITCKFLTPKPSDLIPQTIITPLATFTNYIRPATGALAAGGVETGVASNSIQLNSYPDKVFVFVRNAQSALTNTDADAYCKINKVQITLGAQAGILSTFQPVDLYRASFEAGSQQTFGEFTGHQHVRNSTNHDGVVVSSVGSVLCLDFGQTINISDDYFAPGSLNTVQFQITVDYENTTGKTINPEMNLMFMFSGVLSTSNGASSSYTQGVLSRQVVLDVNAQEPVNKHELNRMVGGGLWSSLKSIARKAMPHLGQAASVAKNVLGNVNNEKAQQASNVLGKLGFGMTGGEDYEEGGRRRLKKHLM